MIILPSQKEPKVNSYFSHKVTVNWEGWKQLQIPFSKFHSARSPAGWSRIDMIRFTAKGWDLKPIPGTVLHLDQIELLPGTAPTELASAFKLYVPPPPADAFLKNLRKEHPRLLLTPKDVVQYKEKIKTDPQLKEWYAKVKKDADKLLSAKPSIYEKRDGRRLLDVSRRVVGRIYDLGFVYLMSGEAVYLRRAYQELEAAGNFPDWNPSHYLDTGEMMHAFGIGYDWLYHGLNNQERTFIRTALQKHGLRLSASAYQGIKAEGSQSWKRVENNWNFVCNGGSSVAAMAVLDEMPEVGQIILNSAFTNIQIPIAHFEPDGAWWEGVGYWGYSLQYFSVYLKCLETAFGTDFGLIASLQGTGFSRTGDFPIYLISPTGSIFNFADSGGGSGQYSHPAFFYLANKFKNPLYQWFQLNRDKHGINDILYYEPSKAVPSIADMKLDRYFKETEVATLRNSWTSENATFVGFKAGRNGIAHSHDDLGSFILYGLGEKWFVDLGTEHQTYLGHQHSYKRWEFYRIRAEGHNTLVFNPKPNSPDQNSKGATKIGRYESQPQEAFLTCDLTDAYEGVTKAQRGLRLLDNRNTVLVQDEIEMPGPSDIWWFAHTPAKITIGPDKRTASLSQKGKKMAVVLLSPANAELIAMDAAPLPSSPNPAKQELNRNYRKLAIHCQGQKLTVALAMTIHYDFEEPATAKPILTELSSWKASPATPKLAEIKLGNQVLENFTPGVYAYWVTLDKDATQVPSITAAANNPQHIIKVKPPSKIPGTAEISIQEKQSLSGTTKYRVTFLK
jgi:hypothetical protein